ncbi:MAG TPA: heme ABC transporter permease CcmC [Alphaproteobacteria bacterium]|jgi:heme exporter protein C
MQFLANPARFLRIANALLPWLAIVTVALFASGLYYAFFDSPPDYQQGDSVRIMYVHVPAAWMAMMAYAALAVFAAMLLVWKHPLAEVLAKAAAPLGAGYTFIALVSGSLWGRPSWGTWWAWGDARLTSVLVLFFFYLGHMALTHAFDDAARGAKAAAVLALVGVVNLPVVKFSVDWWSTLHQPASISRIGASAIDPSMLTPLLLMAGAFLGYFLCLLILRARAELARRKVRALQLLAAEGG